MERNSEDYKSIVTNPASTPADREKAKACLKEYAVSIEYMTTRETDSDVVDMFARFRSSCIWSGIIPQPLPLPVEEGK